MTPGPGAGSIARQALHDYVRGLQPTVAFVARWGPSARRVPPELRRAAAAGGRLRTLAAAPPRYLASRPELVRVPMGSVRLPATTRTVRVHRRRLLPRPWLIEVAGGSLVGRHATPVAPDGTVALSAFGHNLSMIDPDADRELADVAGGLQRFVSLSLPGRDDARPLISLVGRLDSNYYHWLVDFCTGLEGTAGVRPQVLIRHDAPAFVRSSLAALGFVEGDLVRWPLAWDRRAGDAAHVRLAVPRLLLPSPRSMGGIPSFRALRHLRSRLLGACREAAPATDGTHLYVHRPVGGWRSIANDEEILAIVRDRGFAVVRPERLDFARQVATFANADIIVGLHGAGLTNVLFSDRATVVEIAGAYGGLEFAALAAVTGGHHLRHRARVSAGDDVAVCGDRLARDLDAALSMSGGTTR